MGVGAATSNQKNDIFNRRRAEEDPRRMLYIGKSVIH